MWSTSLTNHQFLNYNHYVCITRSNTNTNTNQLTTATLFVCTSSTLAYSINKHIGITQEDYDSFDAQLYISRDEQPDAYWMYLST